MGALLVFHASAAWACFPGVGEFLAASPASGATDVPRDGAIEVSWTSPSWVETFACSPAEDWQVVARTAVSQEVIPGSFDMAWKNPTWCDGAIVARWQPTAAMPAGTEIQLDISYVPSTVGTEPDSFSATFTTGAAFVPELSAQGPITASTLVRTVAGEECMQPLPCGGGGGCTPYTERQAVAKVAIGPIAGGQADFGYLVEVAMGEGEAPSPDPTQPHTVRTMGSSGGAVAELVLPDLGHPYVPCFSAKVHDASGQVVDLESICLEEVDPAAMLARTPDPTDPTDPTDPGGSPDDDEGGCSIGSAPHSTTPFSMTLLFSILSLGLRRRANRRL